MLEHLSDSDFLLSDSERLELEPIFWHSTCTEYDARHFNQKIHDSGLPLSPEFQRFLGAWLEDEINHADGFRRLYSLLYDKPEPEVESALASRPTDFSVIKGFFDDEFKLSLLLAYDEIVTTLVYQRSIPLYRRLGPEVLLEWIHRLKIDEARHFLGIIGVVHARHRKRIPEARAVLDEILRIDRAMTHYGATFVLDHACPDFSLTDEELEELCARAVMKKLHRG